MSKLLGTLRKKGKKGTYYYRVQIATGERREFSLKTSDPVSMCPETAFIFPAMPITGMNPDRWKMWKSAATPLTIVHIHRIVLFPSILNLSSSKKFPDFSITEKQISTTTRSLQKIRLFS